MPVELPVGFIAIFFAVVVSLAITSFVVLKTLDYFKPEWAKKVRKYQFTAGLGVLVTLLVMLILAPIVLIPIYSGQAGVMWLRFGGGTVLGEPFNEGTVLVMPWNKMTVYSSRFQTIDMPIEAVTAEGLKISLDVVIRYSPVRENIPMLHKVIGTHYPDVLLVPEVGSSARLTISNYGAEQIYSELRQQIQREIFNDVNRALSINERRLLKSENITEISKFVYLEDVLIRDVKLPAKVDAAIVNKVNQKYLDEEYVIRLQVAKKEAQRKETEAKGIAAFQSTVVGGISETYLRWRGIEATVELAKSNNAKVVVIGGGRDGLPLILNTESQSSGQNPLLPLLQGVSDDRQTEVVQGPQNNMTPGAN